MRRSAPSWRDWLGDLQPSAEIIAPADLLLSLELHRACGPPLYDLASDCSVAGNRTTPGDRPGLFVEALS